MRMAPLEYMQMRVYYNRHSDTCNMYSCQCECSLKDGNHLGGSRGAGGSSKQIRMVSEYSPMHPLGCRLNQGQGIHRDRVNSRWLFTEPATLWLYASLIGFYLSRLRSSSKGMSCHTAIWSLWNFHLFYDNSQLLNYWLIDDLQNLHWIDLCVQLRSYQRQTQRLAQPISSNAELTCEEMRLRPVLLGAAIEHTRRPMKCLCC